MIDSRYTRRAARGLEAGALDGVKLIQQAALMDTDKMGVDSAGRSIRLQSGKEALPFSKMIHRERSHAAVVNDKMDAVSVEAIDLEGGEKRVLDDLVSDLSAYDGCPKRVFVKYGDFSCKIKTGLDESFLQTVLESLDKIYALDIGKELFARIAKSKFAVSFYRSGKNYMRGVTRQDQKLLEELGPKYRNAFTHEVHLDPFTWDSRVIVLDDKGDRRLQCLSPELVIVHELIHMLLHIEFPYRKKDFHQSPATYSEELRDLEEQMVITGRDESNHLVLDFSENLFREHWGYFERISHTRSDYQKTDAITDARVSEAILLNVQKELRLLLEGGGSPNAKSVSGERVLFKAIHKERVALANDLLEYGADVNFIDKRTGLTPFYQAFLIRDFALLQSLADRGADVDYIDPATGYSPLHVALETGDIKATRALVACRADVEKRIQPPRGYPMGAGEERGSAVDFASFRKTRKFSNQSKSPLEIAVHQKDVRAVNLLLFLGVDINAYNANGHTLVQKLAYVGDECFLDFLLETGKRYGLDVNKPSRDHQNGVLIYAKNIAVLKKLLDAGASIDQKGVAGKTALHSFAHMGQSEEILELANRGGDISCETDHGKTALYYGAKNPVSACSRMLLTLGMDPRHTNEKREHVAVLALRNGNRDHYRDICLHLLKEKIHEIKLLGVDPFKLPPLHLAVALQDVSLVSDLVRMDRSLATQLDEKGRSAVFYCNGAEIFQNLLEEGFSFSAVRGNILIYDKRS